VTDQASAAVRGRVVLAERLGRNVELTVDVAGAQLIVLASGSEGAGEGAHVGLAVADSDIHIFAAGEGDTVRLNADDSLEVAQ